MKVTTYFTFLVTEWGIFIANSWQTWTSPWESKSLFPVFILSVWASSATQLHRLPCKKCVKFTAVPRHAELGQHATVRLMSRPWVTAHWLQCDVRGARLSSLPPHPAAHQNLRNKRPTAHRCPVPHWGQPTLIKRTQADHRYLRETNLYCGVVLSFRKLH